MSILQTLVKTAPPPPPERQSQGAMGWFMQHRTWPGPGVLGFSRGSGIYCWGSVCSGWGWQRPVWLEVRYEGEGRSWKVSRGHRRGRAPGEPSRSLPQLWRQRGVGGVGGVHFLSEKETGRDKIQGWGLGEIVALFFRPLDSEELQRFILK